MLTVFPFFQWTANGKKGASKKKTTPKKGNKRGSGVASSDSEKAEENSASEPEEGNKEWMYTGKKNLYANGLLMVLCK